MKANLTNLRKALKACAKAHNAKFDNWSSEGQLGVWSTTPGTICDVRMILSAFFGTDEAAEVSEDIGCITIWLDDSMVRSQREVDETTLALHLPYGTKL